MKKSENKIKITYKPSEDISSEKAGQDLDGAHDILFEEVLKQRKAKGLNPDKRYKTKN